MFLHDLEINFSIIRMKHIILFVAALLLLGCAATGPAFQSAAAPKEDDALIYVYRPESSTLSARSARIHVDGAPVVDLSNNGYTTVYVKAGRHKVSQYYPALLGVLGSGKTEEPVEIWIDAKPNQRHYVEVFARHTTTSSAWTTTMHFVWTLAERNERDALPKLSACKFQSPTGQ